MKKRILLLLLLSFLSSNLIKAQTNYTGFFRTNEINENYHHFTRNSSNGAAVYINQVSPSSPILRLSSGVFAPNQSIKFTFENNGHLGIGTTKPYSELHIGNGTTSPSLRIDKSASGTANLDFYSKTIQTAKIYSNENEELIFETFGSSNDIILNPTGNVGIGTIDPIEKLTVEDGNIAVGDHSSDNWSKFSHIKTDNYGFDFQHNNATAIINEQGTTNQAMVLGDVDNVSTSPLFGLAVKQSNSNWQPKFIVTGNGNVGIGTMNINNWKLAVNGNIRAKEIKVETGWSDFVFYDNYKLPTLKEVENHIKEKGHLKDIPSAKEVEQSGIFLGEMDSKLLLKIEELTLYTIQQEKQIKEQAEKIENLESLNNKLLDLQKRLEILEKK